MMAEITLNAADGTVLRAFVAQPESLVGAPGLILFQEAFGVNDHIRDVATRFAAEGYVVIAPEMFHRTADPGFEASYDNFESVRPHLAALTAEGIATDAAAAHDFLVRDGGVEHSRVAAVGYCMGGRCAFIANSTLPLRAAVSYYGGGIRPSLLERAENVSGPHLFFWGGKDRHIPASQRAAIMEALEHAGKAYVNVEMSKADHGFFCDERPAFEPDSAAESWALTLSFLQRNLDTAPTVPQDDSIGS
jgi:carboxymethylenebutenolidase